MESLVRISSLSFSQDLLRKTVSDMAQAQPEDMRSGLAPPMMGANLRLSLANTLQLPSTPSLSAPWVQGS